MGEQSMRQHTLKHDLGLPGSALPDRREDLAPLTPLSSSAIAAIRAVPYLRESSNADLNIDLTLDYMVRRYVGPLAHHVSIARRVMADCAAGFGWLSFAFLLSGGGRAVLIDANGPRLDAARQIAEILSLADRCDFILGRFERLALAEDSVDIFASIATLECVGRENIPTCIAIMSKMAQEAVLLTTPNFMFPVIGHDTRLPLAHWLPASVRGPYAAAFGRRDRDWGNDFVRPWQLQPLRQKFRVVTRYQTFQTAEEFDRFYPHYKPYGHDEQKRYRQRPEPGLRLMHKVLATTFGSHAYAFAPNLASIWVLR